MKCTDLPCTISIDHFSQTSTHNFKMADAEIVDTDYSSWKIADLKKELKAKGLPVSGKKEELVERLMVDKILFA